jgi:hypothetical protein
MGGSTHGGQKSKKGRRPTITAADIELADKTTEEIILPSFCPEHSLEELKNRIRSCHADGIRRFRIVSLYGFSLLRGFDDITITTGFPLPAANRYAFYQLFSLGAEQIQIWLELERDIVATLSSRFESASEIYTYGRPPLLQTRAKITARGTIRDNRGNGFIIEKHDGLTFVYPEYPFAIDYGGDSSSYIDLGNARSNEEKTADFNVNHVLV